MPCDLLYFQFYLQNKDTVIHLVVSYHTHTHVIFNKNKLKIEEKKECFLTLKTVEYNIKIESVCILSTLLPF